jgi:hypothetical protein
MTAAIVFALLARQASAPQQAPPIIAAGATPEFAKAALAVEASLVAGDIPAARRALAELPTRTPKVSLAGQDVLPETLRSVLSASFRLSTASWSRYIKGFTIEETASNPDWTLTFAPVLPDGPAGLPVPTQIETGPPFKATLGVGRGKPLRDMSVSQMNTEIAYSIGRYLGVGENPFPGSAMYRNPNPLAVSYWPSVLEARLANQNLELSERLRAGVEAGKPIGLTASSLELAKPSLELGEVKQGTIIRTQIELKNNGDGPMDFVIKPDCSCFQVPPMSRLEAHRSTAVRIIVDTSAYIGQHDKVLLLQTNDPLKPNIQIPVSFRSRPAYRLFRPLGENFVVPAGGGGYDVYLVNGPGETWHPKAARLKDIEGKVTWSAWSGSLADPDMNEGALPREGWKFRIQLPAGLPSGRVNGALEIDTDSAKVGAVQYAFTAQKGIVPLGGTVYFPNVVKGAGTSFLISRPNQPFKIKRVDGGPFKARWHDNRGGWEYAIDLEYPGGAAPGDFLIPIRIHTDDPQQPLVEALVSGTIK